jgi:hypothetical protein
VFLDFTCRMQVKRYGKKRSDMPQYLEERLDKEFFRFCKLLWNFSKTRKRTIMSLHKKHPDKPFFTIESRRKTKKLLNQWRDEKAKYISPAL